ncbi:VanZ like family protein [Parapedobacter luteus]|uniref:VanZ like family protein n=1 Tax=Parapedobacter luteus TaxID=623280 RepID=A0A1T5FQX7_9SPHI|nr:VanZ like family protein [Parapedobacter luteus]
MRVYVNIFLKLTSILYTHLLAYTVFGARRRWYYDANEIREIGNWMPLYVKVENWPKWEPFSHSFNEFYLDLFGNIVLFIPFPFFLFFIFQVSSWKKLVVLSAGASLCIEINQYYWGIGVTDVDDLLLNTFGGLIGAGLLQTLLNNKRFQTYAYPDFRH